MTFYLKLNLMSIGLKAVNADFYPTIHDTSCTQGIQRLPQKVTARLEKSVKDERL